MENNTKYSDVLEVVALHAGPSIQSMSCCLAITMNGESSSSSPVVSSLMMKDRCVDVMVLKTSANGKGVANGRNSICKTIAHLLI